MNRNGDLVGARFLDIIKGQLPTETDQGVIKILLRSSLPSLLRGSIPIDMYHQNCADVFNLVMKDVLFKGVIKDDATQHMILEYLLNGFVATEDQYQTCFDMFTNGKVWDTQ